MKQRCATCTAPIDPATRGRPRRYCGDPCRYVAYRRRRKTQAAQIAAQSRDHWWTPEHLRSDVLARWHIGLDAAACAESRVVDNYLGPDHADPARRDALLVDWAEHVGRADPGRWVYLNPPYRPVLLRPFLRKAVETSRAGTGVVALIPASTDTLWWAENVTAPGAEVEFLVGRLSFGGPHAAGGVAPFGSALVVWNPPSE